MLKILKSTAIARRSVLPMLAAALVLPCAAGTATLTTLYSFTDLSDGGFPEANLVISSNGSLFGTTASGGSGWGTVFQMIPSNGGATWTEKTIYEFTGGADGANPIADLAMGNNNVLYGTTYSGGLYGYGTVFQVSPGSGGSWNQKVLYSFAGGSDGANPAAGITFYSKNGVLYGTTVNGGSANLGTVFELIPAKTGWTEKVLHTFVGGVDGANPLADLALTSTGTLYGTASQGGQYVVTNQPPNCTTTSPCTLQAWGVAFELTPMGGGNFTETLLYTFTGGTDGGSPESSLVMGSSGAMYGTTFWGGANTGCPIGDFPQGCGTVYQLLPPAQGSTTWTEKVLYAFTGHSTDGSHPYGNLGISTSGELFGTTFSGGGTSDVCSADAYFGCGTVFAVKPSKTGTWTKSNIMALPGSPGPGNPNGLALAKGGNMYGTSITGGNTGGFGTVFLMTPGS